MSKPADFASVPFCLCDSMGKYEGRERYLKLFLQRRGISVEGQKMKRDMEEFVAKLQAIVDGKIEGVTGLGTY